MSDVTALLSAEMNNRVSSFQKRPGLLQIIAPFYHDDGDMQEVFVSPGEVAGTWVLSDFGMTLQRTITQIMALKFQKTQKSASTFYDDVRRNLIENLAPWNPQLDYLPISNRDDLIVDVYIESKRPIYIYAARDDQRYLRAGITCAQFVQHELAFRSLLLVEAEKAISLANRKTVTNIVDKQFIGTDDILKSVSDFVRREVA